MSNFNNHVSICISGQKNILELTFQNFSHFKDFKCDFNSEVIVLRYSGEIIEFEEKINFIIHFIDEEKDYFKSFIEMGLSLKIYCSIFSTDSRQFGFDLDSYQLEILNKIKFGFSVDFW